MAKVLNKRFINGFAIDERPAYVLGRQLAKVVY